MWRYSDRFKLDLDCISFKLIQAAHCHDANDKGMHALLYWKTLGGEISNEAIAKDGGIYSSVTRVFTHPDYNATKSHANDIAIWELQEDHLFNPRNKPLIYPTLAADTSLPNALMGIFKVIHS